jgi:hypothetical protein
MARGCCGGQGSSHGYGKGTHPAMLHRLLMMHVRSRTRSIWEQRQKLVQVAFPTFLLSPATFSVATRWQAGTSGWCIDGACKALAS